MRAAKSGCSSKLNFGVVVILCNNPAELLRAVPPAPYVDDSVKTDSSAERSPSAGVLEEGPSSRRTLFHFEPSSPSGDYAGHDESLRILARSFSNTASSFSNFGIDSAPEISASFSSNSDKSSFFELENFFTRTDPAAAENSSAAAQADSSAQNPLEQLEQLFSMASVTAEDGEEPEILLEDWLSEIELPWEMQKYLRAVLNKRARFGDIVAAYFQADQDIAEILNEASTDAEALTLYNEFS